VYNADMIEWEETESGLRVYDRTKTEVSVETDGWETTDADQDIDRPLDETVSGYVSEIRLPAALVKVTDLSSGEEYEHGGDAESLDLPESEYRLNIELNIKTYLQFTGAVTIEKTADFNELYISFPEHSQVTFGFRSFHKQPADTLTVPPTPEGVATAVTHLSSVFKTTSPMRSYPTLRGHPPKIELGGDVDVPEPVREEQADVGIELLIPNRLEYAFVAAPLAYYLQAEMKVTDRNSPVLRATETGVEHEFEQLPKFQHEIVDVTRRVFFLDCLVRNAGDYSWDLVEMEFLEEIGIDATSAFESTPAERLHTYLDAPFDLVDEKLPEWHLALHVSPDPDNITSLPYFLNNLSLIYLPESNDLEKDKLLNKSIDDFYRNGEVEMQSPKPATEMARTGTGPVKSVDRRDPVLHEGQVNGWLADGVPIDVFKTVPQTYQNRFKYVNQSEGDIDVTVILNDEEMVGEHETVAQIYEDRAGSLPIDVTVHEHLSKAELASVFESSHDFVHYIGHCEEDGLRCSDGNLSISDIEESNVQTFFLNACGSYYEGRNLVEKGSVAGAVTFTKVLNKQAAKVGVAFSRLLINGYDIAHAIQLARRRIMMGKDYAVVGDGTHQLTQCDNRYPNLATLEEKDGHYQVEYRTLSMPNIGGVYQVYRDGDEKPRLHGTDSVFVLEREELLSFLERAKMPLIYDGDLYWSKELMDTIRTL
jgi:hypothetical protein